MPLDRFGRKIHYFRISVTDRCNMRCIYCTQRANFSWLPHEQILSYEELFEVIQVATGLGFDRIRLTGGEPLIRKGIVSFVSTISRLSGIRDLSMTTNGVLLAEMAKDLKQAGLKRINISLDSLDPETFEKITGRPYLSQVLDGVEAALKVGFLAVKINVVVMRGINDDEIIELAKMAIKYPIEVRFIEFMPIGKGTRWENDLLVTVNEMKERLAGLGRLSPVNSIGVGPAETFVFPRAKGRIGFIGAMSHHFCERCNRLRLTSDGRLRPCLFLDLEFDLKSILRRPHTLEEIKQMILHAVVSKPKTRFLHRYPSRLMRSIGG